MKKILSGGAAGWLLMLITLWNPMGAFAPRRRRLPGDKNAYSGRNEEVLKGALESAEKTLANIGEAIKAGELWAQQKKLVDKERSYETTHHMRSETLSTGAVEEWGRVFDKWKMYEAAVIPADVFVRDAYLSLKNLIEKAVDAREKADKALKCATHTEALAKANEVSSALKEVDNHKGLKLLLRMKGEVLRKDDEVDKLVLESIDCWKAAEEAHQNAKRTTWQERVSLVRQSAILSAGVALVALVAYIIHPYVNQLVNGG